mmetsp:Transcript_24300/g.46266  ORF Transcript_24300/g.46266 Transcript_24300/m.46266 type:complete len:88 (+) Transcript_24300:184-447(+)
MWSSLCDLPDCHRCPKPRIPKIPGHFAGQELHSFRYRGGRPFAHKRVVVIGSNNSGFEIAQDLWEQGAKSVTISTVLHPWLYRQNMF